MKNLFLSLLIILTVLSVSAQSSLVYSLTRPPAGGDLQLMEYDLVAGTETMIKSYTSAEIDNYNPDVTGFDPVNSQFLTLRYDLSGSETLISINTSTGNIDHMYTPSGVEVFSIEYAAGKLYSLTRPISGGSLQLMEFDVIAGSQTTIQTYSSAEIDDYNPEATSFNHANNHFIALRYPDSGPDDLISIDIATGNIDHSYVPTGVEVFSIEQHDHKTYALTRPSAGGDLELTEFDIAAGSQTSIKTYTSAELDDYNPETTSFDYANNQFLALRYTLAGDEDIISIDASTGAIDYSFSSTLKVFSLESAGATSVGLADFVPKRPAFLISPNPVPHTLHILRSEPYSHYEIMGVSGAVFLQGPVDLSQIEVSTLPAGMYWLRLNNGESFHTQKFIKQ